MIDPIRRSERGPTGDPIDSGPVRGGLRLAHHPCTPKPGSVSEGEKLSWAQALVGPNG